MSTEKRWKVIPNLPFDLLYEHKGTSGHTEMIYVWHDLQLQTSDKTRIASTSCLKYIRHIHYGRRVTRVNGEIPTKKEPIRTLGFTLPYNKRFLIKEYLRSTRDIFLTQFCHNKRSINNINNNTNSIRSRTNSCLLNYEDCMIHGGLPLRQLLKM